MDPAGKFDTHFRHAVPERAGVVDLGESQIFEGHVAEAGEGGIDIEASLAHLFH